MSQPFWKTTPLAQMSREQWESLCDGCGRCCLIQLEDEDRGELFFTDVVCRLLDTGVCRCTRYLTRQRHVPTCMVMSPDNVEECAEFAPPTCAYRLLVEGRDLPSWHPLVSGDPGSVHAAGISVRGRTTPEAEVDADALEDHVVDWPLFDPTGETAEPPIASEPEDD